MWQTQFATHLEGTLVFSLESGMRGTFKPSITFIEALEEELAQSDFAVLTLTPDDQTESRGKVSMAPRDNVLFELGLFMGRLGRNRTLLCVRQESGGENSYRSAGSGTRHLRNGWRSEARGRHRGRVFTNCEEDERTRLPTKAKFTNGERKPTHHQVL